MNSYDILGPNGVLAQAIPGYGQRPQQLQMAKLIEQCIEDGGSAIIEAGTGTGKSYAYLIPAILSGEQAIVSTANKALQTQLLRKDLPKLAELLDAQLDHRLVYAAAKGKHNYICMLKSANKSRPELDDWLNATDTGDIDEAPLSFSARDVAELCVDDGCIRSQCPYFYRCHYLRARERLSSADVIVTNHALLCQQTLISEARILPDANVLVIDEAHQLEAYAVNADSIEIKLSMFRGPAAPLAQQAEAFLEAAGERLRGAQEVLIPTPWTFPEGEELAGELSQRAYELVHEIENQQLPPEAQQSLLAQATQVKNLELKIRMFSESTRPEYVRHVRRTEGQIVACVTRHDVRLMLEALKLRYITTIYTSATLASGPYDFRHFIARNGLSELIHTLQLDSPFDYQSQCLLYLPMDAHMPQPDWRNAVAFERAAREQTWALVQASGGSALCLYTSTRAMQQGADDLRRRLDRAGQDAQLCRCQGEAGKLALTNWLRSTPGAILCATNSFWEGIDIPGDALRLVVIDKLPFAQPGPVEQARQEAWGRRAFIDLVVPEATLRLKQGFGRLIRTSSDRGVVAILDPRLWEKPYGRRIAAALPDARVVSSLEVVRSFFAGTLDDTQAA